MAPAGGLVRRTSMAAIAVAAMMWLASRGAVSGDFYLQAGIGPDKPDSTAFTDINCSSTVSAAPYGCGTGGNDTPYRLSDEFGTIPAVELGLGYCPHSD